MRINNRLITMYGMKQETKHISALLNTKIQAYSFASDCDILKCKWINEGDQLRKLTTNVYEVKKKSGINFKINKIGNYFITAAHCLENKHKTQCVTDHDIALYNMATGKQGNEAWHLFKKQLINGKFHDEIYQVNGSDIFKPGDSGLLCNIINSKQRCKLLECDVGRNGVLLISGGTTMKLYNGLLAKQNRYGSAGSIVNGMWVPIHSRIMVFAGKEADYKEMFGVKWLEFEKHSKIMNLVTHPYHILDPEEREIAKGRHQFPNLVTEKIHDIKQIRKVKIPKPNGNDCYIYDLNTKLFSFHETDDRFIFAVLPAFEIRDQISFKSGTPIFNAENDQLISCITKHYKNVYPVSGIGWESGQISKDKNWLGVQYHYVGVGKSVYGNYYGPYDEVKKLADAKASETFGEKTGLGVYVQDKMVQVVTSDENGKERWRVRLFHENCQVADSTD